MKRLFKVRYRTTPGNRLTRGDGWLVANSFGDVEKHVKMKWRSIFKLKDEIKDLQIISIDDEGFIYSCL